MSTRLFAACSAAYLEHRDLEWPCAVIRMVDEPTLLPDIKDKANCKDSLDLYFNDSTVSYGQVHAPTQEDAEKIATFVKSQPPDRNVLAVCTHGKGRSKAVSAALHRVYLGQEPPYLYDFSHNRLLYKMVLESFGVEPPSEPLVSIVVRVKYPPDRLQLFLLSVLRQRYENWEVVVVTDGPNSDARKVVETLADDRIKFVETDKPLGRWGHPYRNLGVSHCTGEYVCFSNDDNYLTPGYLEQMTTVLHGCGLVICFSAHSYVGWKQHEIPDLGSFMYRTELARRIPWCGNDAYSEGEYLEKLKVAVNNDVRVIQKPLFVKN